MRNPSWTTDELILALDLYFRLPPNSTSKANPHIIELSEILNRLPIHPDRPDAERFRNPNGVYMKLCNFLRFDPSYSGVGLKAGSHKEQEVWNEFANDIPRLQQVALAIRSSAGSDDEEIRRVRVESDQDIEEAPEGTVLSRLHRVRERNGQLVRLRKEKTLDEFGSLPCEVCAFDFGRRYGDLGEGFIECHHLKPLSLLVPGEKTRLTDLSLTCSNCHRMLHHGRPWPTLSRLRARLSRPEYADIERFQEYIRKLQSERSLHV